MKNWIFFLLTIFIFSSCKKEIEPQSPEEIFEKYKGSVVLITNQFYYEIINGGDIFYYSPSSLEKIYMSKEEVLKNLSIATGTGFIISKDGEIITNRHVVSPTDENYQTELYNYIQKNINRISENAQKYNDSIESLRTYYRENSLYISYYDKENLEGKFDFLVQRKNICLTSINILKNVDYSNSSIKFVSNNLGIAFNDTYVTDTDDLQECVLVKQSEKENVDLALIQTKSKIFNKPPSEILNFKDNNPNIFENPNENPERDIKKPVKINSDVYMIGYNRGFALANTKQGIKSQFTIGKVSQENDSEKILYTIPTLEGSSGSPIIDKWGNLVAVNFAKIIDSQSFSFGIPVYNVKQFYEE